MIEHHIILDEIDPSGLYGVNNSHLQVIRGLFPKLRITARENVLRLCGDELEIARADESIGLIIKHLVRYNVITDEEIVSIVKNGSTNSQGNGNREDGKGGKAVVYTTSGKGIKARSANQQKLIDAFNKNDMIFAVGPAGTGKTYLSIALAVKALKEKWIKRIILSRPAVEAGEKLGFLPGDLREKIDPYLQPLYDALQEMIPAAKLQDMMAKDVIQIAPLAFMRGRTLNDAVVILDEAQNTTSAQLRMFLTRMGWNTKMIVTGDLTQVDLPNVQKSGLREACEVLQNIEGLEFIFLNEGDIVRHKLVTKIVKAYESINQN